MVVAKRGRPSAPFGAASPSPEGPEIRQHMDHQRMEYWNSNTPASICRGFLPLLAYYQVSLPVFCDLRLSANGIPQPPPPGVNWGRGILNLHGRAPSSQVGWKQRRRARPRARHCKHFQTSIHRRRPQQGPPWVRRVISDTQTLTAKGLCFYTCSHKHLLIYLTHASQLGFGAIPRAPPGKTACERPRPITVMSR